MRRHARVTIAIAALAAFLVSAATASAGYVSTASFSGPGSGPGQLDRPGRAALEPSTGNLFVADSGNDRVNVYEPDGSGGMQFLTAFGTGELDAPFGIAIDEEGGQTYVYVADAGNERIVKYDSDEAATPAFTLDATFPSPAKGTGSGQIGDFHAALAVDPTSHDLLVADYANQLIHRFEADGTFDSSFDGSNGGTALDGPLDVAVNSSGDVIVLDATGTIEELVNAGNGSTTTTARVERYSFAGAHEATLGPIPGAPAALAVIPGTDQLLVAGNAHSYYNGEMPRLHRFAADNSEIDSFNSPGSAQYAVTTGLAGTTPSGPIFTISDQPLHDGWGLVGGLVFVDAEAPSPTASAADDVTATSATLHGEVDPNGAPTSWRFEYSTDQSTWIGIQWNGSEWIGTPHGDAGNGTTPVAVSGTLGGLEPNMTYYVRLVATSAAGETISSEPNPFFTTNVAAPVFTAASFPPTTYAGGTKAMVGTYVNPRNSATSYWVEYGTTTAYGTSVPASEDADAGSGGKPVPISLQIGGLTPETTYHYRLVAANAGGIVQGPDQTFETGPEIEPEGACPNEAIRVEQGSTMLPDCRAWEKVTPQEKGGVDVGGVTYESKVKAAANGGRLVFTSGGQFANSVGGALPTYYLSRRGVNGWTTQAALPKSHSAAGYMEWESSLLGRTANMMWIDEDLETSYLESTAALAPGTEEGVPATYKRDDIDAPFELVTPLVGPNMDQALEGRSKDYAPIFMYASGDGRHMLFNSAWNFETDEPGPRLLYQVDTETGTREIVTLPDGEPAVNAHPGSYMISMHHALSEDGSRLYFCGGVTGECEGRSLYFRDGGETTLLSNEATFFAATPDGGKALFKGLENNSPAAFIYDAETGAKENISAGLPIPVTAIMAASEDLEYVYMVTTIEDGDLPSNSATLYLWHDGDLRPIATLAGVQDVAEPYAYQPNINAYYNNDDFAWTPDGTSVIFKSGARITGYDSGKVKQIYRYDAETDEVRCLSCPEGEASGDAMIIHFNNPFGTNGRFLGKRNPISADGKRVFFSTPDALVEEDTNGLVDAYVEEGEGPRLISSGTAKTASRFLAASANGDEVFIGTAARLSRADEDDLVDIYVAKVGGGFPEPPFPAAPCQGEACQPAIPAAPGSATVTTNVFSGAGNPPVKRGCPKPRNQKKKRQGAGKRKAKASVSAKKKGRANCKRRAGK